MWTELRAESCCIRLAAGTWLWIFAEFVLFFASKKGISVNILVKLSLELSKLSTKPFIRVRYGTVKSSAVQERNTAVIGLCRETWVEN